VHIPIDLDQIQSLDSVSFTWLGSAFFGLWAPIDISVKA